MKDLTPIEADFEEKMMHEILASEKLRVTILASAFFIFALFFVVVPKFLPNSFPNVLFSSYRELTLYQWIAIILSVSCIYQLIIYGRYKRVTNLLRRMLVFIRYMNVFVETSIPTVILVVTAQVMEPTSFITSPFIFIYFLFITLSALRLDYKLCTFTGLVAALEYFWVYQTFVVPADNSLADPFLSAAVNHMGKAAIILLSGLVAGFITVEIKRRVKNSLKSIEEKNELNRKMLEATKEYSKTLEIKVADRTEALNQKNRELSSTLKKEEEANKKVMDSIQYSKMIQSSLLPDWQKVNRQLPNNFFIWQPRDIVGGDLIVLEFLEENFLAGVIDCTGHGVPGALMTMMASTGLRRITTVDGCRDPAEILRRLNHTIKKSLHQDTEHAISDDGLDASICYIDRSEKTLTYAGARLPLTYLKDNKIETIKGDHQSIGYRRSDLDFKFVNHTVDIQKEMTFYLYSDGIIDQLGGEKRIPFGRKRLHDLLRKIHNEPFDKQQSMVYQAFEEYKGDEETQDDITVLGFSAL